MRGLIISVLLCLGCAPTISMEPTADEPVTYELRAQSGPRSALGHDHRPRFRVYLDGRLVDGLPEVIASVALVEGLLVVDVDGRLMRIESGAVEILAERVVGLPAVDGERFAWITREESQRVSAETDALRALDRSLAEPSRETRLVVHTGNGESVETGLFALGALRFVGDAGTLIGIGAENGGLAGYYRIDGAATCLSNCGLRVGGPLDAFVPASADLRVDGDSIVWRAQGRTHSLRWMR